MAGMPHLRRGYCASLVRAIARSLPEPGDVAKAYGAGADFVMLGGMLAGHDECDGDVRL